MKNLIILLSIFISTSGIAESKHFKTNTNTFDVGNKKVQLEASEADA